MVKESKYKNGFSSIEAILDSENKDTYSSEIININSNGIIFQSDLHRQYAPLEKSLEYAKKNNRALGFGGDIFNDYDYEKYAEILGFLSPKQLFFQYLEQNLSTKDLEAFSINHQLSQFGGLDQYLQLMSQQSEISQQQIKQEKNKLEKIIERVNTKPFVEKINSNIKKFQIENGQLIYETQIAREELYLEMVDIQARETAKIFNRYDNVHKIVLDGNHENRIFWNLVSKYLINKEQLIQIARIGVVKITNDKGLETVIGGLTNCSHIPNVVNNVLNSKLGEYLYSHLLIQDSNQHYNRINKTGEKLDILMSHGQIGDVNISKNKSGINVKQDPSIIALSQEIKANNGYIVEGHIHKTWEFVNSYGAKSIRSIGNEVYDLTKNKNGKLEKKLIKLDADYSNEPVDLIGYDYKLLKRKINLRIKNRIEFEKQAFISQKAANDDVFDKQLKVA